MILTVFHGFCMALADSVPGVSGGTLASIPFIAAAERTALKRLRGALFALLGMAVVVGLTLLRGSSALGSVSFASLSPLSLLYIFLSGAVAITAMALPGSGWLWVLGGSVLACVLTVCLQVMQRRSGLCMREAFDRAFGTGGGRVAAAAELLWLLFAASGAAAASQIAFEDDLGPFLSAIPLLLAALAGQKGRLAVGRVCGALALCLAGLYAIITAASLRHVQAAWCRPEGVPADAALALCLCLAPACLAFIAAKEEMPRNSIGTAAVSALLPAVPAFLTAACLSPELARQEPLPFLTLTKSLSVMSVMQRFELLLSVAQLLGLFALLTMLACAAGKMAAAVRGKRIGENESGMFCLLAFGGSFFAYAVPMWVWAVGAAVFWGLVPILTQVIVNIKKSEK